VGEIKNFHLTCRQRLAQAGVYSLPPSDLQKCVVILEIYSILNATEIALAVVIKYGGYFCGPKIRSVWIPISRPSPLVIESEIGGVACLVTGWI
jgi:hypothetical protein